MGRLAIHSIALTGGNSGIGRAVVQRFLEEGASVSVMDLSFGGLTALGGEYGGRLHTHAGDVTSSDDNDAFVAATVGAFGKLDAYVANAGIWDWFKRLEKMSTEQLVKSYREIFDVNVLGGLLGAHAATAALRSSGGSLIFTASPASSYAGGGGALYTASKHAVAGLVKQLAKELSPEVRVNGVAPGGTVTALAGPQSLGMSERRLADNDELVRSLESGTPLARAWPPEAHASMYVLLASRTEAPASTGCIFESDGGYGIR